MALETRERRSPRLFSGMEARELGEEWRVRNRNSELGGITGLGENAKYSCCYIEFEVTVGMSSESHTLPGYLGD